ncbi:MAG: hypothetical protein ABL996_26195, partial [Micropepsaceae bacterium]
IDNPSRLATGFVQAGAGGTLHLHAMHSGVDWFAFAVWRAGRLERALSLSPDSGVIEDIGAKMAFEQPYWAGQHPAIDPEDDDDGYPFPFEPDQIPLMRYKRSRSRWKLWR